MASLPHEDLNEKILKQLECPVCFEYCMPPIYMCENGHNLCSDCHKLVNKCGICRSSRPNHRNRTLEDLSHTVLLPCRYGDQGCRDRFCFKDLQEHLQCCDFSYKCYINDNGVCKWNGAIGKLQNHAKEHHKGRCRIFPTDGRPISWQFNLSKTYEAVALFVVESDLFWCSMLYDCEKKIFSGYVRYVGKDSVAEMYECRYSFRKEGRRLSYACGVMMLHEDILRKNCEMLRGEIVDAFADNNFLTCDIFVYKK